MNLSFVPTLNTVTSEKDPILSGLGGQAGRNSVCAGARKSVARSRGVFVVVVHLNANRINSHSLNPFRLQSPTMSSKPHNRLPLNLPQLQNCIKKDPSAYEEEFHVQFRHYESVLQILMFNPAYFDKEFESLVMFLAHTCPCYKKKMVEFPKQLMNLLRNYSTGLHRTSRLACCKALMILRAKSFLELQELLPLFFELAVCPDKTLRSYIRQNIISDIKSANKKSRNEKINRELQRFMFTVLSNDQQEVAAKMALDIMTELYKKNVWRNKELVNQIAQACLSRSSKILVTALQFFLGTDDVDLDEKGSSDEEEEKRGALNQLKDTLMANRFNKSSRKRQKLLERIKKTVRTTQNKEKKVETFNFSALHLINDPQTLAEKLFSYLESTHQRFEVKLMLMNLISRLIGIHDLLLLNFYPYLTRYLQPHQVDVTKILQYAAQSAHKDVPPNELEPILRAITNNFVTEKNSTEAITVGLNSIRELCNRNPLVMDADLLQDLVQYQKYKNKNVSIAAKSLVYLFRIKNPDLLNRKDRGKPTLSTTELRAPQFGETDAKPYVAGAEALNDSRSSSLKRSHSMLSIASDDMEVETDDEDGDMDISSGDEHSDQYEEVDEDEEIGELEFDYGDGDNEESGSDSSGESDVDDQEIVENLTSMRPEDAKKKAEHISTERILTTKEIKRIKAAQMAKQLLAAQPKRLTRKDETTKEVIEETLNAGDRVRLEDIERIYKKPKHNKESRLATVIEGREGREKFGVKKPKMNEKASTSNRDKRRNKAFGMIKHKLKRHKKTKTFHEKQVELKQKLLNRERKSRK